MDANPVRAVEIKLSQGAKPGLGGLLPGAKVTPEIAEIRGVPVGEDVYSPATHSAFSSVDDMLDFVERLAEASGLPVGIKSAVGDHRFFEELANLMSRGDRGVDFITIDGGEGGTGAAPLAFSDHVALPFKIAFSRVYRILAEAGVHENVVLMGSGKLGFPAVAMLAFALGCDTINVAREAMMAVGCIQAQRCHTDHCPTGVTTHNRWLVRGLDPTSKAARLANYVISLRKEILQLSRACGVPHPGLLSGEHIEILDGRFGSSNLYEMFGYRPEWGFPVGPGPGGDPGGDGEGLRERAGRLAICHGWRPPPILSSSTQALGPEEYHEQSKSTEFPRSCGGGRGGLGFGPLTSAGGGTHWSGRFSPHRSLLLGSSSSDGSSAQSRHAPRPRGPRPTRTSGGW